MRGVAKDEVGLVTYMYGYVRVYVYMCVYVYHTDKGWGKKY